MQDFGTKKENDVKYEISCKLEGEFWWYGATSSGYKMPVNSATEKYLLDARCSNDYNQICTLLLSDAGRYIYVDGGCTVEIGDNKVVLSGFEGPVDYAEGFTSLKEAYLAAAKKHFFRSEKTVPQDTVLVPQYCSWVEMLRGVNQADIERYAESVVTNGMPAGCFIIDDGWSVNYGEWDFVPEKFPDPKTLCDKLHALGFKVIVWICPFVNRGTKDFAALEEAGAFVKDASGKTAMRTWWSDTSAVLDLTSPVAYEWIKNIMLSMIENYGVDGFKMDAGDMDYYRTDDITCKPTTPAGQCKLWAELASEFEYSELRACVNMSGYPIVQRLGDKDSSWANDKGIGSLIPNMATSGLAGYAYCCPDMIGGGQETNFGAGKSHDVELFIRSSQCAALMPMMQFSYAIWEHYKDETVCAIVRECANLRVQYKDYFLELMEEARTTFAPMLRNMEYEFPRQGMQRIRDQFMLGDTFLVAPVLTKGTTKRSVVLPFGAKWRYIPTGKVFEGGQTVVVPAPIDTLPYFERVKK